MFDVPPPQDQVGSPSISHMATVPTAAERAAARAAAEQVESFIAAVRQGGTIHAAVDNNGSLSVQMRDSDGNVSSEPLVLGNVWDELAKRGIELQPQGSEVLSFTIGMRLLLRVRVTLHVGFFGRRKIRLHRDLELEWT
jgi:hypothetical protein